MRHPLATVVLFLFLCLGCGSNRASADITFIIDTSQIIGPRAADEIQAIEAAARNWSGLVKDDITVRISVNVLPLPNDLGDAVVNSRIFTYDAVRNALARKATSSDDFSSIEFLSSSREQARFLLNRTAENPAGGGSSTPYLDDNAGINNSFINVPIANARALGLIGATAPLVDGYIYFNNSYQFSYCPHCAISAGTYDLVGVAMHEIGHILGLYSGVNVLDAATEIRTEDSLPVVMPFDFFQFSNESVARGAGVFDFTSDDRPKYFSIDGGRTALAPLSTGEFHGDGYQSGHWKSGLGLGLMAPTVAQGQALSITPLDLRALDVLGFTLKDPVVVPEPGSAFLLGCGGAAVLSLVAVRRRRDFSAARRVA